MTALIVHGFPLLVLLFAFAAWAQDVKGLGVVTAVTGRADLKRPQAPQAPLKLRDNLFVRDVVDTHKEALARILLLGRSTVTVRELSRFEIREETLPDGAQRAVIDLAAGKIRVMVARRLMKPGDEVQIRTPNAMAAVRGSDGIFEVTTLPDGRPQSSLLVVLGELEVTTPSSRPIAMVEKVSDAPSGIWLAQAAGVQLVRALERLVVTGVPGLQQVDRFQVPPGVVQAEVSAFKSKGGVAGGTNAQSADPPGLQQTLEASAQAESTRTGEQPALTGGTTTPTPVTTEATGMTTAESDVVTPTTTTTIVTTTPPSPEEETAPPPAEEPEGPQPPGHMLRKGKGHETGRGKGHEKFDDPSPTTSGIISVLDAIKLKIHSGHGAGGGPSCAHGACGGGQRPPICPPGLAKQGRC